MINKFKKKGPQVISNLLPDIAKKTLKRRGFFEIELLKNWENLIDKKYQNQLEPIKIKRSSNQLKSNSHILCLLADPSIAFAIQHDSEKIIKKVNLFFGYKAIDKLEIFQKKIDSSNRKKSNNNSKLNNNFKKFDERYKELNKYPDLRKNFQTILSKITKS